MKTKLILLALCLGALVSSAKDVDNDITIWQFRADENDIHGTIPDVAVPAQEALDRTFKIINEKK